MTDKKTRLGFTTVSLALLITGYVTGQTWLYTAAIGVTIVGLLVVGNHRR